MQQLHDYQARILSDFITDHWDDFVQYLGQIGNDEPEDEAEVIHNALNDLAND